MKDTLIVYSGGDIGSPEYVQAVNALKSKEVPKSAVKEHPGKGGKTFSYVDHIWITETLQSGLPANAWSFEVLSWEIYHDKLMISKKPVEVRSVTAQCRFTLHIPLATGEILNKVVTEVGVFEPNESMSSAAAVASAVSRGLCRCIMRSIGLGIQFYKGDEEELSPAQAWTSLKVFAQNQGADWNKEFEDNYIALLKQTGITREHLVSEYKEAYHILSEILGKTVKLEEMPE